MANERYSILLADRRITVDGEPTEDEFNKVCVLLCDDARVAIAFTGLATCQGFNTSDWLVDTLAEIGRTSGNIVEILTELAIRIKDKLKGLLANDKRLSFLITGFVYWEQEPHPVAYVLSNHVNTQCPTNDFTLRSIASSDGAIVEVAGTIRHLPAAAESSLRRLLTSKQNPPTVLRFAVKQLLNFAIDSKSAGLIGTQCNSAIILAPPNTTITTTYHSAFHSYKAYGSNVVLTKGMRVYGPEIFSDTIMAGKEIRKKDPCWCGSGQKFKHCHLKKFGSFYIQHAMFKRPMYVVSWMDFDEPRPSGRTFCVSSGYE
jgi:SEC-C motif